MGWKKFGQILGGAMSGAGKIAMAHGLKSALKDDSVEEKKKTDLISSVGADIGLEGGDNTEDAGKLGSKTFGGEAGLLGLKSKKKRNFHL